MEEVSSREAATDEQVIAADRSDVLLSSKAGIADLLQE
jgi:hypothetical protein